MRLYPTQAKDHRHECTGKSELQNGPHTLPPSPVAALSVTSSTDVSTVTSTPPMTTQAAKLEQVRRTLANKRRVPGSVPIGNKKKR